MVLVGIFFLSRAALTIISVNCSFKWRRNGGGERMCRVTCHFLSHYKEDIQSNISKSETDIKKNIWSRFTDDFDAYLSGASLVVLGSKWPGVTL